MGTATMSCVCVGEFLGTRLLLAAISMGKNCETYPRALSWLRECTSIVVVYIVCMSRELDGEEKKAKKYLEKNSLLFFSSPEQQLGFLGGMETGTMGGRREEKQP